MANDVRRLARSMQVDVSTDGTTWLKLKAVNDANGTFNPNLVDSTDYDGEGFGSQEITLQNGSLVVKYNSLINAGVPNPGQGLVEACEGQFGDSARLWVRFYDIDGGTRGWKANCITTYAPASTGVADLRAVTATFTFDGDTVTRMTSSDITAAIGASAAPVITAASQTGTGVGSQVTLTGSGFTGATSVKFGATSAPQYTVVSDYSIVAVVPTGGTGTVSLTVTTSNGTSAGFSLTVA